MKKYNLITMLIVSMTQPTFAAEFCVTSSAGLQIALNSAASNSEHDLIKIAQGSYTTLGTEFSYLGVNSWDLEISGGWTDFFGIPCGQQLSGNAYNTLLDGNQMNRVLLIRTFGTANIKLSNLMLANGFVGNNDIAAGLYIFPTNIAYFGNITIEQVAIINNTGGVLGAAEIFRGNKLIMRNNLIAGNHSMSGHNTRLRLFDATYFTNNTVYFNTHDSQPSVDAVSGISIFAAEDSQVLVANNLFWDNDNHDLRLYGSGNHFLHNNNIGSRIGVSPFNETSNTSLPPRFDNGILNFTPSTTSPLVNAGRKPCTICPFPVPFDEAWALGSNDMQGDVRVQSGAVDIGAFESPYERDLIYMNTFD